MDGDYSMTRNRLLQVIYDIVLRHERQTSESQQQYTKLFHNSCIKKQGEPRILRELGVLRNQINLRLRFESIDDALEVSYAEGSTTDKATVYVGVSEELLSVRGLAATTIEDRGVVSHFLAELLGDYRADVSVNLLSLLCSSGLTSTDSPYGLVSEYNLREVLSRETKE